MDVDETIPRLLYGDGLRIRQVIINIMNNAVKFTEEGSVTVTVKIQKKETEKVQLYVSVKDTGQGIHNEDLKYKRYTFISDSSCSDNLNVPKHLCNIKGVFGNFKFTGFDLGKVQQVVNQF